MKRKFVKLLAFTLAELLVTLSIVGVVSALTVPTLMNRYQAEANVAQLRKVYLDLGQAADLLITAEGKSKLTATSLYKNSAGPFLKTYLKIAQDCGDTMTPCFAESYRSIDGAAAIKPDWGGYAVTLTSGAAISMTGPNKDNPANVVLDINGPDKPNIAGRDLFSFSIFYDGSIDDTVTPEDKINKTSAEIKTMRNDRAAKCLDGGSGYAAGCFTKILNANWKMDY